MPVTPRRESPRHGPARIIRVLGIVMLVTLVGLPARLTAAHEGAAAEPALAPVADVLSASSWLWATARDPRHPASVLGDLAWAAAWDGQPLPAAPGSLDRAPLVSRPSGGIPVTSEPGLAINPRDPDHLILAAAALDLPSAAVYVSRDGGETWQGPHQAPHFPGDVASVGGPVVAFGQDGVVYLVAQSIGVETVRIDGAPLPVSRSSIVLSRSQDGGETWAEPRAVAVAPIAPAAPDPFAPVAAGLDVVFLDRPAIAIVPDPRQPEREIVAVAYTEFRARFSLAGAAAAPSLVETGIESTIRLARSSDGGQTWDEPVAVSPTVTRSPGGIALAAPDPGAAIDDPLAPSPPAAPAGEPFTPGAGGNQVVQGAAIGALPDGALVAAWLDSTADGPHQGLARVMVARSDDGGRTFAGPVQAGLFHEIAARPRQAFFRWWDGAFPRLAIGPTGEIVIAVAARPDGPGVAGGEIVLLRSPDGGQSWEPPIRPADASRGHFFPALAVAADGTLHAIWGELGGAPAGAGYAIAGAVSADQGATWQAAPLTDAAANTLTGFPGGRYLGGRLAIAAAADEAFAAWPQTRSPGDGPPGQQIAVAHTTPAE